MAIGSWFKNGYEAVAEHDEEAKARKEAYENGGGFTPTVLFQENQSRTLRFLMEEPVTYKEHYLPNAKGARNFTCMDGIEDENGNRIECPFCASGNKPSFRGAYLVIDRTEDSWTKDGQTHTAKDQIKVFKQGISTLKVLEQTNKKRKLTEWEIEITRTGSGTDSRYTPIPESKVELSAEDSKKIADYLGDKTMVDKCIDLVKPVTVAKAYEVLGIKPQASTPSNASYDNGSGIGL